jgi:phosphopantothenoylcysteine decarboxylase/phosphopantothenate--cysteine ligase
MSKSKILIGMTGSIACYKICEVISALVKAGHQVKVVATKSTLNFVGEATLEGLTGNPVLTDTYQSGNMMDHIHVVRWADLILVAPATANTINKFSAGIGDDLLSTCFLAHDFKKPFLIAPAMNHHMFHHPTTQKSMQQLAGMGITVLPVDNGNLACNEIGDGRLLEPQLILNSINQSLGDSIRTIASDRIPILITGGGTREPVDAVRFIGNVSTGKTAAQLSDSLAQLGFDVTGLFSKHAELPKSVEKINYFESHQDLSSQLKTILATQHFAAVVHMAAVSDFTLDPAQGKLSSGKDLNLSLRKTEKIIDQIKSWSLNPKIKLIGFKLTAGADDQAISKKVTDLFAHSKADLIIHNDLDFISDQNHNFLALDSGLKPAFKGNSKQQLGEKLSEWIQKNTEVMI